MIGYEFLMSRFPLRMPPLSRLDQVRPVARIEQILARAYQQIDREFDLPNRTIDLLIQWIRQNNCRLPERRRTAAELIVLKPQQIERIEAIVADCFSRDANARN